KSEAAPTKKDPSATETQPAPTVSPTLTPADQPLMPRPERSEASAGVTVPRAALGSLRHGSKPPGRVRRRVGLGPLLIVIGVGGFFYREVLAGWSRFADL